MPLSEEQDSSIKVQCAECSQDPEKTLKLLEEYFHMVKNEPLKHIVAVKIYYQLGFKQIEELEEIKIRYKCPHGKFFSKELVESCMKYLFGEESTLDSLFEFLKKN